MDTPDDDAPKLTDQDKEFIGEHLAEARVFRSYGFSDQAWDEYVAVLERFPDNPEANREILTLDCNSQARTLAMLEKIAGRKQ